MPGDHHALEQLRKTLRPQSEKGQTKKGGPLGDDWLKEKWPEVLGAHYQCAVPGPSACLQDALHMITTGKFRITCPGAKRKKEEDVEEPRTVSELEVHLIREWYDKKDNELVETRGEAYITEHNLSAAARQYHDDNMIEHTRTHERLAEITKTV